MKKIVIILAMLILGISITDVNAQSRKMGNVYDYLCDPTLTQDNQTNKAVIQWFINNFDEYNIPIISYTKVHNKSGSPVDAQGGKVYPLFGLDSAYRRYPAFVEERYLLLNNKFFDGSESNTKFITYPAYSDSPWGTDKPDQLVPILTQVKHLADSLRDVFASPISVAAKSRIEDGYYIVELNFKKHSQVEEAGLFFNLALVEAYHVYGQEEHYFSPVHYFTGLGISNLSSISMDKKTSKATLTYKVPINKLWNPKYLYCVVTLYANDLARCCDAATDNVVDVKAALKAKPLYLEIVPVGNSSFQQLKTTGEKVLANFTVSNPSNKSVEAQIFINKATSTIPESWDVSLNKTKVTIPAGQTTTVTATVQTSGVADICALDVCVLPINTDDAFNPQFTSAQAVIANKEITTIIFTDRANNPAEYDIYQLSKEYSAHGPNIGLLDPIFHKVIPVASFDGFIYNCATIGNQRLVANTTAQNSNWLNFGVYNPNFTKEINGLMAKHLEESEIDFLLEAQAANKHVALFFDKSWWYYNSKYPSNETKNKFSTLCNNFGISVKADSTYYIINKDYVDERNYCAAPFVIKGNTSDSLTMDKDGNSLVFNMNAYANNEPTFSALYGNKFNILNTSKSSSVAYFDPSVTNYAMVKTRNGNQKMFVGGFNVAGMNGAGIGSIGTTAYTFFDNLFTWWYGYKVKKQPEITVVNEKGDRINTLDFGTVERPQSKTETLYIKNIAEPEQGPLKIYSCIFDFNDDDAFEVLEYPKEDINPGEQAKLVIKFTPKYAGDHNITLAINCNDPINSPYSLYINGTGKNPAAGLEPKMVITPSDNYYDFGEQEAESGPYNYDINIYNEGGADLEVSIKLNTDAPAGVFELLNADFTVVRTGTHDMFGKDFSVIFNPPAKKGTYEGSIEITSNDPENPTFVIDIEGASEGKDTPPDTGSVAIVNQYACSVLPNVVNSFATINFSLESSSLKDVNINILNLTGEVVKNVIAKQYTNGSYSIPFDAADLSSGSYFVEYTIGGRKITIPFKVVK